MRFSCSLLVIGLVAVIATQHAVAEPGALPDISLDDAKPTPEEARQGNACFNLVGLSKVIRDYDRRHLPAHTETMDKIIDDDRRDMLVYGILCSKARGFENRLSICKRAIKHLLEEKLPVPSTLSCALDGVADSPAK